MRVVLHKFERDDIPRLAAWIDSPGMADHFAGPFFRYPITHDQLEAYRQSAEDPMQRRRIYKAVDDDTGDVLGHIELSHIWPALSGRISRVLVGDPARRGRGIGAAMVRRLVVLGFAEFDFARFDMGMTADNAEAIACYRKVGFRHVGTWPAGLETSTGPADVYWMSLVREDFRAPDLATG